MGITLGIQAWGMLEAFSLEIIRQSCAQGGRTRARQWRLGRASLATRHGSCSSWNSRPAGCPMMFLRGDPSSRRSAMVPSSLNELPSWIEQRTGSGHPRGSQLRVERSGRMAAKRLLASPCGAAFFFALGGRAPARCPVGWRCVRRVRALASGLWHPADRRTQLGGSAGVSRGARALGYWRWAGSPPDDRWCGAAVVLPERSRSLGQGVTKRGPAKGELGPPPRS